MEVNMKVIEKKEIIYDNEIAIQKKYIYLDLSSDEFYLYNGSFEEEERFDGFLESALKSEISKNESIFAIVKRFLEPQNEDLKVELFKGMTPLLEKNSLGKSSLLWEIKNPKSIFGLINISNNIHSVWLLPNSLLVIGNTENAKKYIREIIYLDNKEMIKSLIVAGYKVIKIIDNCDLGKTVEISQKEN